METRDVDEMIESMKGTVERGDCLYCGAKDAMVYTGNICFICDKCSKSVHEDIMYAKKLGLPVRLVE